MSELFDLAIIGGGINGCGVARDAAGRGLKVYLCEKGDLGGATSSASTKLLHGGLRYLEHYEFRLVREALEERERLWSIAPHIVRPLRFVLPQTPGMRPAWMLRTGLFLYDHLGKRTRLPGTSRVDFHRSEIGSGLRPSIRRGFEYSDCWVEDNRLVILNAQSAKGHGAVIEPHTVCIALGSDAEGWTVRVRDRDTGAVREIRARVLVNAGGPWANELAGMATGGAAKARVRLVQGSHIVVPQLYTHDRCFIFQNPDGRIVFTIPYEQDYTLIGTTDRDYDGSLDRIEASQEEITYLCRAVSAYFVRPVTPAQVVWSYSGVRPLHDSGDGAAQAATRDYVLDVRTDGPAPLLTIYGGKITTYRRLAEAVLARLESLLPGDRAREIAAGAGWSGREALPGGGFPIEEFGPRLAALREAYPWLGERRALRMFRQYGTRLPELLDGARAPADLGTDFGAGLTEAEVDYLVREEWARSAADIVYRRSKLGLRMTASQIESLDRHLAGLRPSKAG
ncbi:MAG: glycerol-3-phosphate dehydrogenase [Rhodobacteraceae bacterium]|nr:glycerol-3-phosphate dehydrogenase [Paracoccaceae bacterium]